MDKQYLQETKQLNAQSRSGASSAGITSSANDSDLQEARQLNAQSATSGASNAGITSSTSDADLQEAKQLNAKSKSTTGMQ